VIALPWLGQITHSALVADEEQIPTADPQSLDDPQAAAATAEAVWVPNRNGIFLNIAAAYCEALDCAGIVCGFNTEEAESFPDNSRGFMQAAQECFAYSTQYGLRVISPTVELNKTQIVKLGYKIGGSTDTLLALPVMHAPAARAGKLRLLGALAARTSGTIVDVC